VECRACGDVWPEDVRRLSGATTGTWQGALVLAPGFCDYRDVAGWAAAVRGRSWFVAGVLSVPGLVVLAERVTGRTLAVWWAWRRTR
jgi:hypothetical protein